MTFARVARNGGQQVAPAAAHTVADLLSIGRVDPRATFLDLGVDSLAIRTPTPSTRLS